MNAISKFVNFDEYCSTCKHRSLKGSDEPCNECLMHPVNENSHKPIFYEKEGE